MKLCVFMLMLALIFSTAAVSAGDPDPAIPTPMPREYNQDGINATIEIIETQYGIGVASRDEWSAGSVNEVMWFTDDLHGVLEALDIAAYYLWLYGEAPEDVTPAEFFRLHFDRAHILIDRATQIPDGFTGNTVPVYDDGEVSGYVIQLHPAAMGGHFVLAHELGHVLDSLLDDLPQREFVAELGGEWTAASWIPGAGYMGNEELFPRAVAGPNEDFADTFSNMMLGRLSPERVMVRYDFIRTHLPVWLAAIRELPE